MKLSNQDFRAALGLPANIEEHPRPQPVAAEPVAATQQPGSQSDTAQAPMTSGNRASDPRFGLRFKFCTSIRNLCAKHISVTLTKREQREHVLSSLVWLSNKSAWVPRAQQPVTFWHQKAKQEGRIDLGILDTDGAKLFAVLVNFSLDESHFDKLKGALQAGYLPVLVTLKSQESKLTAWQSQCKLSSKFASWLKVVYLD